MTDEGKKYGIEIGKPEYIKIDEERLPIEVNLLDILKNVKLKNFTYKIELPELKKGEGD